jgi:signal transduction histidine kinase
MPQRPGGSERGVAAAGRSQGAEIRAGGAERRNHGQHGPARADQILLNLTNNAIKFTDRGVVKIELAQKRDNGLLRTRFNVVDTGIGIPAQDQGKLFQAFEQLRASGTRRHQGTGLGLHLSQKLAALIGGHIEFESEAARAAASPWCWRRSESAGAGSQYGEAGWRAAARPGRRHGISAAPDTAQDRGFAGRDFQQRVFLSIATDEKGVIRSSTSAPNECWAIRPPK